MQIRPEEKDNLDVGEKEFLSKGQFGSNSTIKGSKKLPFFRTLFHLLICYLMILNLVCFKLNVIDIIVVVVLANVLTFIIETVAGKMTEPKPNTPLIPPTSPSRNLPDFKKSVKLKYVKLGYHYLITHGMFLFLSPLVVIVAAQLSTFSFQDLYDLWVHLQYNLISVIICSTLLVFLLTLYFLTRPRPVYLVDFSCYKPEESRKCTKRIFMDQSRMTGTFTEENLQFQKKILERSGLGDSTYLPEAVLNIPPNPSMKEARKEAEAVMFGAIDELLSKTGVKAKDIGILVVNCSLFCPTPSLSAMIVNHYKLRGNITSYNLGGMGCSAGLISIDLAKQLLQVKFLPLRWIIIIKILTIYYIL